MPTIQTSPAQTIKVGQASVYVADAFDDTWVLVPYLYVESLQMVAGPDVDECRMVYEYGKIKRPRDNDDVAYAPQDLNRKYVKVIIRDGNGNVLVQDDGTTPQEFAIWYGVIEVDERDVAGSLQIDRQDPTTWIPTGNQVLTAYGLLRELEKTPIRSAVVENQDGSYQTIERGLPFNDFAGGAFSQTQNRSENVNGNYDGYIFSHSPTQGSKWDALESLKYLLNFHAPVDFNKQPVCTWEIIGEVDSLTWYDISLPTDRRSVKDVIDDLIDRRRLVGYYVRGREETVEGEVVFTAELRIFTFADSALSLPGGKTLAANPNQIAFNFEAAFDIEQCTLTNIVAHQADTIRVEGEPITTTCTVWEDTTLLGSVWTSSDESSYKSGAGGSDEEANTIARGADALRNVFSLLGMPYDWSLIIPKGIDAATPKFYAIIDPIYFDDAAADDLTPAFQTDAAIAPQPGKLWVRGKRWLDHLTLKTTDEGEYRRPFVVFRTEDTKLGDVWEFGEKLNANASAADEDLSRSFSTSLETIDKDMQVRIEVGLAGGQQLIASADWTGANATPDQLDPDVAENNAVNWRDMCLTATFEWDLRVFYEVVVNNRTNKQQRETIIKVPNARLDFLLPGTVTDIDSDGQLIVSDMGEIIRDDRERLQQIGDAAQKWYGVERQTLRLTYKQVTPLNIGIGWLITSVGTNYSLSNVNSPITSIRFDLENEHKTTLTTSYAELDLV